MASEPAAASGIPPDPVRWTRSPPLEWWVGVAAAVALAGTFAMMAAAVGLGALADGLLFRPSAPLPLPAAALWAILVLVPSVVLLPAWLDSPRRVGVGPAGVRVEFALRTLLGSWPTVRAMPRPLRGGADPVRRGAAADRMAGQLPRPGGFLGHSRPSPRDPREPRVPDRPIPPDLPRVRGVVSARTVSAGGIVSGARG